MPFVLFVVGKIAIYTFWCWFGVRLLAPRRQDSALLIGLGLAILRIAVGIVVGLAWGFMASNLAPSEEFSRLGVDPSTFIFGFLILRLVQWTGIAWLITLGMPQSELGDSVRSWLWRFGGVMISFVGDIMGLILYLSFVGIVC